MFEHKSLHRPYLPDGTLHRPWLQNKRKNKRSGFPSGRYSTSQFNEASITENSEYKKNTVLDTYHSFPKASLTPYHQPCPITVVSNDTGPGSCFTM